MRYPPEQPEDTPMYWERFAGEVVQLFLGELPTGEHFKRLDEAEKRARDWVEQAYPMIGTRVIDVPLDHVKRILENRATPTSLTAGEAAP